MTRKVFPLTMLVLAAIPLGGCQTVGDMFSWSETKVKVEGERVSIVATDQQLAADPQLAAVTITLPAPVTNPDWPLPNKVASNKIDHLQAVGTLKRLWAADAGHGTDSDSILTARPIVAGGVVYAMDSESHIYAFNAETGARLWDFDTAPTDEDEPERGFGGGVAFDSGKLFAATGFGTVKALDAKTGKELWNAKVSTPLHSAPVVADGRVYVITKENQLSVLDANDGRLMWDHQGIVEPAGIASSPSVAVSGETVVVPYSSGELYALRVDNGSPYWNEQLTRNRNLTALTVINDIAGSPVIDGDLVFAVSHSGTFVAINLRTGGRTWTRNVGSIQTPLVVGEFVFLVSTEGQVLCLSRADGRIKWTTALPAFGDTEDREDPIVWTGPLLVNNRLLLFSSAGTAVSLNPASGQKMNEISIPAGTFVPPAMANGTLYLLTNEAQLVALR